MAELLGVAASAVSLVAFTGQLYKRLSDELDAIISILTKVKSSSRDDDPDLERVLGLIQSAIENLSKTVISLRLSPSESKTRRIWNNVKAVFKNSEISTLLNELERCKSMLLQVTQAQHSEALEGLQRSMTSFSLDQSNQTVSIRKTVSDTQTAVESIQSVVTKTQNVIGTTSVTAQHLANETVPIRATRKEETATQAEFVPATWLTARAFILAYNAVKYFGTGQSSPAPAFGLRTMNAIPIESEIIQAVGRADIHTVRSLFQTGRATPFDVDTRGWNLLQYATFSCRFEEDFQPAHEFGENWKQLGDLRRLIDLLLGFDLDPGEMEPGYKATPLTSFIASWSAIAGCRGVSAGFSDELASNFFKLATNVKTDFSSTAPMSFLVCTDGDYEVVNPPSLDGDHLSFRTIEFLMHHKHWPILWEAWQPLVAASLELGTFRYGDKPPCGRYACRHVVCIYSFVFFWLTATCEEVRTYLDAKMRFLHLLLANGRINNERYMQRDLFLEAVYSVIKSADDIITFLKAEIRLQPGDSEATENSDTNRGIWPSHGPGKCFALEGYVYHSTTLLLSYLTIDEWVDATGIRYEMAHRAWDYVRNHEIMCAFRCAWETVEEAMFGVPVCSHTTAEEIGSYDVEHDSDIDIAESEEEAIRT
ncbi:hypothetical protein V8F06_007142 [Rhypophila decipiens]